MDALIASYADSDSDSNADSPPPPWPPISASSSTISPLPQPPLSLLNPPNSNPHVTDDWSGTQRPGRVRSFPHVDGNYALHVSIPALNKKDEEKKNSTGICLSMTHKREQKSFVYLFMSLLARSMPAHTQRVES